MYSMSDSVSLFSRSIPSYFRWLSVFSWFKYANEGLQINQWSDINYIECNRVNTTCPRSGHAVLESNSFLEVNARKHANGAHIIIYKHKYDTADHVYRTRRTDPPLVSGSLIEMYGRSIHGVDPYGSRPQYVT